MSNGLSSLGTAASINANSAWSTVIDVSKKSSEIAWEAITDSIKDVLETREEIAAHSGMESMVDWVLKPIGAAIGFMIGGPAGAAVGWAATDFITDVASPSPNITPTTRGGVDLKSQYTASRPGGGDFAGDVMGYIQEGYNVYTLGKGFEKTGLGKDLSKKWSSTGATPIDVGGGAGSGKSLNYETDATGLDLREHIGGGKKALSGAPTKGLNFDVSGKTPSFSSETASLYDQFSDAFKTNVETLWDPKVRQLGAGNGTKFNINDIIKPAKKAAGASKSTLSISEDVYNIDNLIGDMYDPLEDILSKTTIGNRGY